MAAARKLGHAIPSDFADGQFKRTAEMGRYLPSTVLDFIAGRPLELEAIWGEAYRQAFNAGAEVGRLETLYHLLRSLRRTPPSAELPRLLERDGEPLQVLDPRDVDRAERLEVRRGPLDVQQ